MFTVVPVMPLMLAGEEVGPIVPLALHELQKMMSTIIPLL